MRIWAAALAPYRQHSGVIRAVSETAPPTQQRAPPFTRSCTRCFRSRRAPDGGLCRDHLLVKLLVLYDQLLRKSLFII